MRLYSIVYKIRRIEMQQIILGSAGFLLYFIYDINSVRKQNRLLQKFFAVGTILVVLSLFMELWLAWGQCSHRIGRMIGFGIGAMCLPRESTQPRTNSAGVQPLCFAHFATKCTNGILALSASGVNIGNVARRSFLGKVEFSLICPRGKARHSGQ